MPPLAYFGVESHTFTTVVDLLIVVAVVVYLSLVYWTYADARRRIVDPMLIGCATAASFFPFVGTLVYIILRPPEYLEDVQERELEMQAAQARLAELGHLLCPHCDYPVERDFLRCPSCLRKLKDRCGSCGRPLDRAWSICPYCEADVASEGPPARARGRRRGAAAESSLEGEELTVAAPPPGGELTVAALEEASGGSAAPRGSGRGSGGRAPRPARPRPSAGAGEELI
jgi:hypothetical protein